jgi:hypothetical protein
MDSVKKTVDFNINDYAFVKLTDKGRAELKLQHEESALHFNMMYVPKQEDEEGWSKWQCHHLMNTFGHMLFGGFDTPFETNIKFETTKQEGEDK